MDSGTTDRLATAFAVEERRGLMLASAARSAAVLVLLAWLAYVNPERGLAYVWVVGSGALLLVTGLAQLWLYSRFATKAHAGGLILFAQCSSRLILADPLVPNPFATVPVPLAMPLRFASFPLLLRSADADGVFVPSAPAPVDHALRDRRVDPWLPRHPPRARDRHRPAGIRTCARAWPSTSLPDFVSQAQVPERGGSSSSWSASAWPCWFAGPARS